MSDKLNIGILTDLSFEKFAPTKQNKKAVSMYAAASQSDARMHRARTDLVESSWLSEIKSLESEARVLYHENTLSYQRRCMRLLPTARITTYQDALARVKKKWELAVEEFTVKWEVILDDARQRLNGDFDPTKYPSASSIRSRFQMKVEFMPMPDNGRLPSYLQDEMNAVLDERIKEAGKELRTRLIDKLTHLADKCASVGGESAGKFYTTNVTNVIDLCEAIPDMLVGDDPDLLNAIEDAKRMLDGYDADSIKSSEIIAQDVRAKASAIASSLI